MAFGDEGRARLLCGASLLTDLVAPTLGPSARTVLVERAHDHPVITGNGYTIALELDVAGRVEQMGIQALRDLAWRIRDTYGDGTATAITLAGRVLEGVVRAGAGGLRLVALVDALDRLLAEASAAVRDLRRIADDEATLIGIGRAAAGGDTAIGEAVGRAWLRVGPEGLVVVEEARSVEDHVEIRHGMRLDHGWLAPAFVTDEAAQLVDYEDPYFLIVASRIADLGAIVPALNAVANSGKPLVIIAEDVIGEALATLVVNRRQAGVKIAAVKAPGVGPWRILGLGDVAVATGATLIADEQGHRLENLRPSMVGCSRRVQITRTATTIIGGAARPADLTARCREIRRAIEREKHLSYDREQHQRRLARLVAGMAELRFGARSRSGLAARRELAVAAAGAVGAALRGGAVPGGGVALLAAARRLEVGRPGSAKGGQEMLAAQRILRAALIAPTTAIAANGGRDGRALTAQLLADQNDPWLGYDAAADQVTKLDRAGVMDAFPIVEMALRSAVSAGGRLGAAAAVWSAAS